MILSILAFIALLFSIAIKDRKNSLYMQSLNCFFESLYAFTIGAMTGAILSVINLFRTFLFIHKKDFSKRFYIIILIFFEAIIIINCIYTWVGIISILPTIGSIIRTYCLWQSDMKLVRLSGITTGLLYGSYYLYYQSWFMVLGDLLLLILGIGLVIKNDIKFSTTQKKCEVGERLT